MTNKKYFTTRRKDALFVVSLLVIPLISFLIFYLYVNFSSFFLAFQKINIVGERYFVGLQNFKEFFDAIKSSGQVGIAFKNSIKMWFTNFAISFPLYMILSYYITKKMPFSNFVGFMVLVPQVVSTFLYALVYIQFVENALPSLVYKMFNISNFPNIIWNSDTAYFNNMFFSMWLSFGSSTLIYSNAMRGIDKEIFESSRLDGVNDTQEFFYIIFPLIWPTVTTMLVTNAASIFTFSGSLTVFYMFEAPPHIWGLGYYFTRTVKVSMANGTDYLQYPMVATSGFVVMVITTPIVFFVKYLMNKFDKTVD